MVNGFVDRIAKTRQSSLSGFQAEIVGAVMSSPLYGPIVSQARNTMVKTAESVGIDWTVKLTALLAATDWEKRVAEVVAEKPLLRPPPYYENKFHGYSEGNLCINAAIEQELAGKAVGARNYPEEGRGGEEALRGAFDTQLIALGGLTLPQHGTIVDMGCGTGTSSRRLAKLFPQAGRILGLDVSPFMVAVGRYLQTEVPAGLPWVEAFGADHRVTLQYAEVAHTGLADRSVDMVSLSFVLHEMPAAAARDVLREAWRILKPGGQFFIAEMDPDTPGYRKLRANPWLYSILRSTEPFLDAYFDEVAVRLPALLEQQGFPLVRVAAATGRHFAILASKGGVVDARPSDEVRAASDKHVSPLVKAISK
ncbi:S-adenosyl-L-methionine-dependent methyltransferase [Ochromonadaceae sp. CCMP2298]|nr:S-adenosyl-L-methionine-dependent methyltransferase [Ochromonadaceae sp. CCMP2298]